MEVCLEVTRLASRSLSAPVSARMRWSQCMLAGTAHLVIPALMNCRRAILHHPYGSVYLGYDRNSDALCRSVLHGYPLGAQLQVSLSSCNLSICESLRWVVYVTVEDLLRKTEGSASKNVFDRLELLLQLCVRRCDGGTGLFGERGMGCEAAGLPWWRCPASRCGAPPEGGRGHGHPPTDHKLSHSLSP